MIVENITVTSGQLNSGVVQIKSITDYNITLTNGLDQLIYRPSAIRINNATGASLSFGLYTSDEHDMTVAGSFNPAPDLLAVANGTTYEMSGMEGEITKIYVSGVSGTSHTANATFVVIKDR